VLDGRSELDRKQCGRGRRKLHDDMTVLVLCLDSLDPVGGLSPVKEDAAAASERPTEPQSEPKDKENVDAKEVDKEKNTEAKGAKKEPDKQAADANAEGGKADGKADGEQASKDAGEIQKPEAGMDKKEGEEEKENVKVEPDDMSLTEQQGGEAPAAASAAASAAEQSAAQPAAAGGAGADTAGEMAGVESWWSSQSEPQESSSEQAADPAPAPASGGVHARGAEGADAAPAAKRPRVSDDASTEPQAAGTAGGAAEAEPKPAS